MKLLSASLLLGLLVVVTAAEQADDPCVQLSPAEMAKAAGVTLPKLPWHTANIWWDLTGPVDDFELLEVPVTIDREIPATYNLYIAPIGVAKINDLQFYGGIQTNINGWANKESRKRVFSGHGGIFSRWSSDKKTPIGLDHVTTAAEDCLVESAGYEGEFASVRRPFAWGKGTYVYTIAKGKTEMHDGKTHTWFDCRIKLPDGKFHEVGSLRFEGEKFQYWARHSAFVEVYSTSKIPKPNIPKVNVTFGWPIINGKPAQVKKASAFYPHDSGPASPDCATVRAESETCVVEVGPIFVREKDKYRHPLEIKREM